MRGDQVVVRDYRGKPIIVTVWEELPDIVVVTSGENFKALSAGSKLIIPIGFPKTEVFHLTKEMEPIIKKCYNFKMFNWKRLTPYEVIIGS